MPVNDAATIANTAKTASQVQRQIEVGINHLTELQSILSSLGINTGIGTDLLGKLQNLKRYPPKIPAGTGTSMYVADPNGMQHRQLTVARKNLQRKAAVDALTFIEQLDAALADRAAAKAEAFAKAAAADTTNGLLDGALALEMASIDSLTNIEALLKQLVILEATRAMARDNTSKAPQ